MNPQLEIETLLESYLGRKREALLPVLWDVQTEFGFISTDHVHQISHVLRVPEADIYGVIGFYTLFYDKPIGQRIMRVCTDPICGLAGADDILLGCCSQLEVRPNETTSDGQYTVEQSPCLGMCDHAPSAHISIQGEEDIILPNVTIDSLLQADNTDYQNHIDSNPSIMLDSAIQSIPQPLSDYGDYVALRKAIEKLTPEQVIKEIEVSNLIGRGGAAFPTGLKWKLTRQAEGDIKYMVCNADESEPGTFLDRILMEHNPHLLLEGIALAAYAVGASQAYIFIRGEYPKAFEILMQAIEEAQTVGFLGDRIFDSEFSLNIELRRGAGAYICGEETALFEAIEGKRGFPRIKPPYPTTFGLFGKPTTVNNVETLCAIAGIIQHGGAWFKKMGTEKSTGTKLVSVSGHIKQPGVYEVIMGITLREFLYEVCHGIEGNLQAILMGGAAGTFMTPDELDVSLTFEDLQASGNSLGSGAIMVFNDTVDLRDVLIRLGKFFQHESCGKCFPCQLGTQRQVEILERLEHPLVGDKERLTDVGLTMTDASICGLGQTAGMAVLSAIKKFPELFES
jgi:NADH-quinone oxidoreductase subunit F